MTIRMTLIAAALTFVPVLAHASGCMEERQAMSCAEGSVYDAATATCVAATT